MRKTFFEKCIHLHVCTVVWLFLLLPAMSLTANPSQNRTVTGVVTSATDGEPLIGVSILVKETAAGTITGLDGDYSLSLEEGQTLVFSYIGYVNQEIRYTGQPVVNVALREDTELLDEVVVIGYGVQKKKLNTGATVQVKGDELAKLNTTSPLQALQGQTPGVQIASTSGQPGAAMKVTIRGLGTVGKSGPLYIIDGIEGDISILNAADIQSIDVLKDAASAAIYGAQAANGVVLVTTKQGSKGRGQVSFDAYYGIQRVARKMNMLNAEQYKIIMNEQALNSGSAMTDFDSMEGLADTDWVNEMFKNNAITQNYSLNVNGGSETSVYSMSLNYTGQEGIVGGKEVSNYERYGFRINSEHKLYGDVLKVGQHLNFNYIKNNGVAVGNQYNNTLRAAFGTSPLSPIYSDNNLYDSPYNDTTNSEWNNADGNPYGMMMTNNQNQNVAQKLLADVYAELEPVKNLKLRTVFGINYSASEYRSYTPLYRFSLYDVNTDHATILQNMDRGHTLTWTNTAGYDFTLNDDHAFNVLIGMEAVRYQGTYLSASNWNLLSQFNDFSYAYLNNTTGQAYLDDEGQVVQTMTVGGKPNNKYRRASYFGRVGYNYREKYMLNATLRADGSSKFAQGNRWGYFPSVSAGWVITNESFMRDRNDSFMDFLKLRVSWGQVGNQNIDDFQYMAPINTSTGYSGSNPAAYYVFGTNGTNVAGAYPNRLPNPNLKWETSEQTNIGIDARFFNGRLNANADFYIKTTKDWLVQAPVLATAGSEAPYINGGSVKNTGFELALGWNDHIGKVNYSINANGAYNKNRVGKIPTEDGIIHGAIDMLYNNSREFYRAENGHALGYFWGYQTAGIFQNQEQIDAWVAAGNGVLQKEVKPGDVIFVDRNKDGSVNEEDKTDLGNGIPKFTYGLNITLDYKGFDLSINTNGVAGNKIVQSYRNHSDKKANYTTAILQRWTGEGTSNKIPRVTENNINWEFSDLFLQKGDYLRINNITLGYDFKRLIKWQYISQCRLYASVQNAFTFTRYDGMDPEIGYGPEENTYGTTENGWVSGVDLGYYPRPRTFLFGINLKF